jgi:peptidase E
MKRMFLTSSVNSVAHDIAKRIDLSKEKKLVFITTPAEPEMDTDLTWLHNDRKALVDAGFEVTDYTITGKTISELKSDLAVFDYIYVSGGNTWYLLQESHKSGFFDLIKDLINSDEKTYIGTSAGSIIAGTECPDYLLEEDETLDLEKQRGYSLVNFTIVPHWGSEDFRKEYLEGRLEIAYKKDQVPLLILTDTQYVIVEGDKFEIMDVKNGSN